jgi:hypothetical protein
MRCAAMNASTNVNASKKTFSGVLSNSDVSIIRSWQQSILPQPWDDWRKQALALIENWPTHGQ